MMVGLLSMVYIALQILGSSAQQQQQQQQLLLLQVHPPKALNSSMIRLSKVRKTAVHVNESQRNRMNELPKIINKTETPQLMLSQKNHTSKSANQDTTLHFHHTAILPLADWELASLQGYEEMVDKHPHMGLRKSLANACHPPPTISPNCCLGSTSLGGQTGSHLRWKCAGSYHEGAFAMVEAQARQFLQNTSGPSSTRLPAGASSCDICRIMDLAYEQSWSTIGLIGDSVQHQVFHGLMCELQRRHYIVSEEQDETHTLFLSNDNSKNGQLKNTTTDIKGPPRTTIKYKGTIRAQSPLWSDNSNNDDNNSNTTHHVVTIHFYRLHKIPFHKPQQLDMVLNETDILMMGFGLHWNDAPSLQTDWQAFFRQITASPSVSKPLLLHRETTAQHFATPTGSFVRDNPIEQCRVLPLHNITSWRDEVIQRVFRNITLTNHADLRLGWIPFFQFSLAQAKLHSSIVPNVGRGGPDCTHFCSTPFLWMPLWRGWRIALEGHVASAKRGATKARTSR